MQTISNTRPEYSGLGSGVRPTLALPWRTLLIAVLLAFVAAHTASAQGYSTGPVSIDLSVLDDNGLSGPPDLAGESSLSPIGQRTNIKKPPLKMPKSRLLVRPKTPVSGLTKKDLKIRMPVSKAGKTAKPKHEDKTDRPKKTVKTPPAIKTAPVKTATTPAPVAPPPVVAKVPSPEKTVTTAKKPEPVALPAPAKTTPLQPKQLSAPEAPSIASAPPPPPVSKTVPEPAQPITVPKAKSKAKPVTKDVPGQILRVVFKTKSARLSNDAKTALNKIGEKYAQSKSLRLQLKAYAGGSGLSVIKAQRLSLSRALAVRSYLIGRGMRGTRINVRALGNKTTEQPFDRVDVNVIKK